MNKSKKKKRPAAILPETEQRQYSNEELASMIQDGKDKHGDLMLKLLEQNKGFCYRTAKPFIISKAIEPQEVQSISFLAMCNAVDYFRSDAGASFIYCLKPFLLRELIIASNDSAPVSLPINMRGLLNRYRHYCSDYVTHHGEPPPGAAILKELKISQNTLSLLKNAERSQQAPIPLDEPMHGTGIDAESEDLLLIDALPDTKTASTEQTVIDGLLRNALLEEISALPDEERKAVENKYLHKLSTDEKAVRRGIAILGKSSRLRAYTNDNLFTGTGFSNFSRTWASQPEKAVIRRMNDK